MTILVSGIIDVDPERRDAALREAEPFIRGALGQPGCVHYAWTADLLAPGRIWVFEEWSSQEAFAAHLAGPQYRGMLGHMSKFGIRGAVTKKYRVDRAEPVYDASGKATAEFSGGA